MPLSRLFPTIHNDSALSSRSSIVSTVRSAVSIPESELNRWRRTFDANAKIEVEGKKLVNVSSNPFSNT
jgi:solute carrier family 25 aspartate/glutamate transporter 12/13